MGSNEDPVFLYYGSKVGAFPYVKVGGGMIGSFHFTAAPKENQKIPNTSAIGDIFERPNDNDIFIKVDKKNNDLIQAYNKTALPNGWTAAMEFDKGPNYHNIYYQYNNGAKQVDRPLPAGWNLKVNAVGRIYYVHTLTNSWQYEYPLPPRWIEKMDAQQKKFYAMSDNPSEYQYDQPTALPPGWVILRDPSGRVYYGNPVLKDVQYDRPQDNPAPTAAATPAAPTKVAANPVAANPVPAPSVKVAPAATQLCALQPGWEAFKDNSLRPFYGNSNSKTVQWDRPCATSVAATPAAVPAPSVAATPSVAVAAPSVEYYYQVGDGDFPYEKVGANNALNNAIASVCPKDNSKCHIVLVRADPKEQKEIEDYNTKIKNKPNGGAKNKKKHRRTKRRTSSKSHRIRTYRRTYRRA
jgi:hypothetical protein